MAQRHCMCIIGIVSLLSLTAVSETAALSPNTPPVAAPATPAICVRFYNDPETIKYFSPFEDFTICSGQASRRVETYADFPMKFECVNPNGMVVGCGIERTVSPEYCTGTPTQRKVSEGQVMLNGYEPSSIKNCTQEYRATQETWTVAAATPDGQAITTDITAYIYLPILETSTTAFSKHGWISPWYTTKYANSDMKLTFNLQSTSSQKVCTTYEHLPPMRPVYHCADNDAPCINRYYRELDEYEYARRYPRYSTVCNWVRDAFVWTTDRRNDYTNTRLIPSPTANMPGNTPMSHFDTMYVIMTDDFFSWHDARMTLHGFQVVLPYWYCDITDKDGSFATAGMIVDHTVETKTFSKFLSSCKEWKLRPHPLSQSEL